MTSRESAAPQVLDPSILLRVLHERRWLLIAVTFGGVVLGALYLWLRAPVYTYSLAIEIGRRTADGGQTLIESPETVIAKLRESYLSETVRALPGETAEWRRYRLLTRRPPGSDIVVIEGYGDTASGEVYLRLLSAAAAALIEDHSRIVKVERISLDIELNRAQLELSQAELALQGLFEQHKLLSSQLQRLDEAERLLTKQIRQLEEHIRASQRLRGKAAVEAADQAEAMTILLLNSQLEDDYTRLAQLERQLHIELNGEREQLKKSLSDNRREQQIQSQEILTRSQTVKAVGLKKQALIETRAIATPARSLTAKGPGAVVVMLLAALAGTALAALTAVAIALWQTAGQAWQYP